MTRAFDLLLGSILLLITFPVMALVAALVVVTSGRPAVFRQKRIGRFYRPFTVFKFRSMRASKSLHASITQASDSRITPFGRFLRGTKMDEVPQLINILRGEMSFVGPRPEVPKFVMEAPEKWKALLSVRPGLTDLASLHFSDEESRLANAVDVEEYYRTVILPDKLRLSEESIRNKCLSYDLGLIWKTFLLLWRRFQLPAVSQ